MKIPHFSVPNWLTLSRIALIPVVLVFLYVPYAWAAWTALVFYLIICATDYLDGWLARRMGNVTALGTFLDPIADKALIGVLLIALVDLDRISGVMTLAPIIIILREFLISGLREFLAPRGIAVSVSKIAKWKTFIQMVALAFLIIGPFAASTQIAGELLLILAAGITVYTGYEYLKGAWPYLLKKHEPTVES